MLKWAVSPRLNGDVFEHDGIYSQENDQLLTLETLIKQEQLPCLVRLVQNDLTDNYCLLLCEITDPYLIVSNETERFSIPISFDGLFASVERGITRYNIFQSIHSLQSYFKSSHDCIHFTTLQTCLGYKNAALRRIRPGTLLEPYHRSATPASSPSPSSSSSSIASGRLRTLFANFPHSLNKHLLPNYQQIRSMKKPISSSSEYLEVRSHFHEEILTLKSNAPGLFVPIYRQLPSNHSRYRSSNRIQSLYTMNLLSKLIDQYPLITELIVSRTLEENESTTNEYPFRQITVHRLVENHPRIIAFDMKNYAFIEIDMKDSLDIYALEHDQTLFQRYQAQLRWCHQHLSSFRSQIKTIVHSANGTAMFIQATPFHGQQLQQYHQRRNSSSVMSSPLAKHIPQTIFTSQESFSVSHSRSRTASASKFYTTSNHSKYEPKRYKGKPTGSNFLARKDVRVYFNDPTIQNHHQTKSTSFTRKYPAHYRMDKADDDSLDGDEEIEGSFQCTAL